MKIGIWLWLLASPVMPWCVSRAHSAEDLPTADWIKGSYQVGPERIKFFAFTYKGKLSSRTVEEEAADVIARVQKNDTTAVRQRAPTTGFPHRHPVRLARGTVLVTGWLDVAQHRSAWLAVDSDGKPRPRHRWLSSAGEVGVLDSGQAWVEPARATARRLWRAHPRGASVIILQMDATMGRLSWCMDWEDR
jgi:hypothetical protein